ncbi:MAG: ATP-binding protein [Gemmatimonadaceae bacterium]
MATITPRAHIGFALATRLIAERGRRVSRQALLALFWPASPASAATHALSEALHKLRVKGFPVRADDSNCVWVAREAASTDIERLTTEPPHALIDRDLTILPGYSPTVSPGFDDWLDDWRVELRHHLVAGLANATERAEDQGDGRTVMRLAEQLLKLDPGNEAALTATAGAVESLRRTTAQRRRPLGSPAGDASATAIESPVGMEDSNRFGVATMTDPRIVSERVQRGGWALPPNGFPAARDTTLVGREPDIVFATELLEAALHGSGGGVHISGAAGIGKSRLVRALSSIARAHGMAVASVACQPTDLIRPLSVFVDIVPSVRLLPGAAGAAPAMAPYLDRLTKHNVREYAAGVDAIEMEHTYASIQHAVFDLLEAVSDEQPLMLVVESAQWLDQLSWSLLREMCAWASTRSVMFVFTSRERWDEAAWGAPGTAIRPHVLPPLSVAAAAEHGGDYADALGHVPPAALMQWCTSACEGNPYLMEELLNHWVATGEQFATPRSLSALLDARLERLQPAAFNMLKICAVMGKNSTLDRLERFLDYAPYDIFVALEELGTAGMLATERDGDGSGNNRVLCRHDVLAQSVLAKVFPASLEWLHRRAGDLLESELEGPNSASLLWDCAGHWHAAGNSVRAVELGRSCIGHLLEIGLAHDAADACKRTLAFCARADDKLQILHTLASVLHLTRSWPELFEMIDAIRTDQVCTQSEPPRDDLELLRLDAEWHAHRDWRVTMESAMRWAVDDAAAPQHRVRAAIIALKIATNLGDLAVISDIYDAVAPISEDPAVTRIDQLTLNMIYHAICGDHSVARCEARALLACLDAEPGEIGHLCARTNCANALCRVGESEEGERAYIEAYDIALNFRVYTMAGEICQHLVKTYLNGNRMQEAETWVHRYMGLQRPQTELWHQRPLRLCLARIELWRGNAESAAYLLHNDGEPLWEDPVPLFRMTALATKLQTEICRDAAPDSVCGLVLQMETLSCELRHVGAQDVEMLALYRGMRYVGRPDEAKALLLMYVGQDRRDNLPLVPGLAAEVQALGYALSELEPGEA